MTRTVTAMRAGLLRPAVDGPRMERREPHAADNIILCLSSSSVFCCLPAVASPCSWTCCQGSLWHHMAWLMGHSMWLLYFHQLPHLGNMSMLLQTSSKYSPQFLKRSPWRCFCHLACLTSRVGKTSCLCCLPWIWWRQVGLG